MLVGEAFAYFFEILDVILALVVAVRPVKSVKMSVLKIKRRLHENPALHINALSLVLGRCQKELPKCHCPSVM